MITAARVRGAILALPWRTIVARTCALLAVWALLLAVSSRERPWADARPIYDVAESIVERGDVAINVAWPPSQPPGKDGRWYAIAPLLQSLVHVPGAWVRKHVVAARPELFELSRPFAAHLGSSGLGAALTLMVYAFCRRRGSSWGVSTWAAAAVVFGSFVGVYARYPYSEILQTVCFFGLFSALVRVTEAPSRRGAVAVGVWAGLLINAKLVFAVTLPGAALYAVWALRGRWRTLGELVGWATLGFAPWPFIILWYNHVRFAAPAESGYGPVATVFEGDVFGGLWGPFVSPGKSLFLFAPPLVLLLATLPRVLRTCPRLLALVVALAGPVVAVYARFNFWSGDWAFGPRYHVFLVPVLLVPAALVFDGWLKSARRLVRAAAAGALAVAMAAGLFVKVVGSSLYWDHWIRLSSGAAAAWLGRPNYAGSGTFTMANCGACFEDMYAMQWLPPFSAVEGHWWMIRHVLRHDDWATAEKDAPWRRYTVLPLGLQTVWQRPRVDWWYMDWKHAQPELGKRVLFALGFSVIAFGALAALLATGWSPLRRRLVDSAAAGDSTQ